MHLAVPAYLTLLIQLHTQCFIAAARCFFEIVKIADVLLHASNSEPETVSKWISLFIVQLNLLLNLR